jgi:hypothetical protein
MPLYLQLDMQLDVQLYLQLFMELGIAKPSRAVVKALPVIFIHNFIFKYACYLRIPMIGSLFLVVFMNQNINNLINPINYSKFHINTFNSFINRRLYAVKPVKV